MEMPNRFPEVFELIATHGFPNNTDDARREFLRTVVIPSLNTRDDGKWGLIFKQEIGVTPPDKMMWRDTGESVDCLTGTGASWLTFPAGPQSWVWVPVDKASGADTAYSDDEVIAFTADALAAFSEAGQAPNVATSAWVGRMQYDAVSIGYTAARAKQLSALRTALGLR